MKVFEAVKTFLKRFLRVVAIDLIIFLLGYLTLQVVGRLIATSIWFSVYLELAVILLLIPFVILAIAAFIPNLLFPVRPSWRQWLGFIAIVGILYALLAALVTLPALEARYYEDRLEVGADTYYLSSYLAPTAMFELRAGQGFMQEYRLYRCDCLGLRCDEPVIVQLQEQAEVSHGKLRYNEVDHSLLLIIDEQVAAVFQLNNK